MSQTENPIESNSSRFCCQSLSNQLLRLRETSEHLLLDSQVPLQERVRQSNLFDCSVQCKQRLQARTVRVDLVTVYKQTTVDISYGKSPYAIEMLEQQQTEKINLQDQIDRQLKEHQQEVAEYQQIIEDYKIQVSDLQQKIKQYQRELLKTNEQKEQLHELYEETMTSRRACAPQSTKEINIEAHLNSQMEIHLMELRIKELRSELLMKQNIITQRDFAKVEMNEKIKYYRHQISHIQVSNRQLQQSIRHLTEENLKLKLQIDQSKEVNKSSKGSQCMYCMETKVTQIDQGNSVDVDSDSKVARKSRLVLQINSDKTLKCFNSPRVRTSLAAQIEAFATPNKTSAFAWPFTQRDESLDNFIISKKNCIPTEIISPIQKISEHLNDKETLGAIVEIKCISSSRKKSDKILPTNVFSLFSDSIISMASYVVTSRLHRNRVGKFSVL